MFWLLKYSASIRERKVEFYLTDETVHEIRVISRDSSCDKIRRPN